MTPRDRSRFAVDQFRDRLKAARKRAGLTQDDLVGKADIGTVTLSKLETGASRPALEIFLALAYALDISPNELLGWKEKPDPAMDEKRRLLLMRLNQAIRPISNEWIEQFITLAELASSKS